jgi:hypothetical protein
VGVGSVGRAEGEGHTVVVAVLESAAALGLRQDDSAIGVKVTSGAKAVVSGSAMRSEVC